jgi:starch synthase
MDILITATEAEGFIKTGGLGDFISGLAIALSQNNVGVKVVLPNYKNLNSNNFEKIASFDITNPDDFNPVNPVLIENFKDKIRCDVLHSKLYGADFYFIDNDYYFNRENIYGYDDDYLRFAFFSRAIKELIELKNWETQIVHINDYHEGVLPLILNNSNSESLKNLKTLLSIHNLYFQGYFEFSSELDYDLFNYYLGFKWESKSSINFLKEAITYSDKIITVSPSYAENIKTKKFGNGLDELLREKSVCGFINGINMDLYPRNSDFESFLKEKSVIKHKIQNKFGLKEDLNTPLLIVIGRVGIQKGSHLILEILKDLISENQMILLGTGVPEIEEKFKKLNEEYSNFVGIIDFDESLAKELYMGGDIFLMPSCFEPCGISQLIAMHYANIPIVYNTGGLKDTIIYSKDYEKNNGFKFYDYDAKEFLKICNEALNIFNTDKWTKIMKNAYKTNYSWENQAKNYIKLYNTVIKERDEK